MQSASLDTHAATLDESAAAMYLGVSVSFLRVSRIRKPRTSGPPFVKMGKAVRYLRADLDAWLAARRITPTAPEAA